MRYVARQPIFDTARQVVAYKILLPKSRQASVPTEDPDSASRALIDAALLIGADVFGNHHDISVPCSADVLVRGDATLLPAARTIVDVSETTNADEEVLKACRELRSGGYRIAVRACEQIARCGGIVELANILHVDFRRVTGKKRAKLAGEYRKSGRALLAENLESVEEFEEALRLGFTRFHGNFFCKPVVMTVREVTGSRLSYIRLMKLIASPDTDLKDLENVIKAEPALCYRFLRFLNSAGFGFRGEITSIWHGLTIVGEQEFRKWLTVSCAALAGDGKPRELVNIALLRARFCELLANVTECPASDAFIVGLFSLMDAVLDTPMEYVLSLVSLPSNVQGALLGQGGSLGSLLRLAVAYESGDWDAVHSFCEGLETSEEQIAESYVEALGWVQAVGA